MSNYPPNGPPPYYGYPAPPPGAYGPGPPHTPGYAYMPAPVMMPMPMYPPAPGAGDPNAAQPTYVTNYIYHGPGNSEPVRVVEDVIEWVPATPYTAAQLAGRAVVGGYEGHDGSPLWVIRSRHNNDLIPGKLAIKHHSAFIGYAGKELCVQDIEVMVVSDPNAVRWVPSSRGSVPPNAIVAGNTASAEPLYIGRARYLLSLTPGKVHPSHSCCYIPYGGNEISHRMYEVLCKVA